MLELKLPQEKDPFAWNLKPKEYNLLMFSKYNFRIIM
jgi:hypothetical protein